ncbi:MAG: hypothetical protein B7Y39_11250 [Bdellovibrio sp. 28-41-41]|nr:MAG: hypothetical protein B7Y39_11250 [Bdellovibrio sp. 28-41-41]
MRIFFFVFILIVSVNQSCFSFENGCQLQPSDLNNFGTKITKSIALKKVSMPKNIPLQSEFEFETKGGVNKFYGTFEGFFRLQNDDFFSLVPLPVLGFDATKDRIVVYICAHYSEKKEGSHLTIFFLRGYHLDPPKLSNFIGDFIYDPQLKVKPVPASLLGVGEVKTFFLRVFRYIPFVDVFFEPFSLIQRFFANLLGDVTSLGVERIEITEDFFRVTSGVDLNSPREARISRTFKLKRPSLGTGADSAQPKTLNGPDEEVLRNLEQNKVEYEEVQ